MEAEREAEEWRMSGGPYVGEISALCLLPLPSSDSDSDSDSNSILLAAGMGSEVLLYHLPSGHLLSSFPVFHGGVRVHGIVASSFSDKLLSVFGETSLKLFALTSSSSSSHYCLDLVHRFPLFDHWVLHACFLQDDHHPLLLAVGLSDNSVALWDVPSHSLLARVYSPDRCLLYSMRLSGHSIPSLRVASGTILNQILVWKLDPQHFTPVKLARLDGHQGSIFALAWSHDASKLMSASDDRSARIWDLTARCQTEGLPMHSQFTLYGHHARIWDCYLSDSVIITAGEDCTCRLWGVDGSEIMVLKEHFGRGIWRCLYEPSLSLVITAGFDSAIKINAISSKGKGGFTTAISDLTHLSDVFTISAPKTMKQLSLMDSKSEYVRCLQFTEQNTLYVSTNNGILYHVNISDPKYAKWTQLVQADEKIAIICMDVTKSGIVALGDGKGHVTIVKVTDGGEVGAKVDLSFTWLAEKERQLLGVFWCKSLRSSHLFTGDPRGVLKLWYIEDNFKFNRHGFIRKVPLIATFESCFGARIMCIDASPKEEILVAGDNKGNLTIFPFPERFRIYDSSDSTEEKIPLVDRFRGAHGISSVTSVYIRESDVGDVEIRTTGGDGCICLFKCRKSDPKMEFIGMKQVKELGTVQSVHSEFHCGEASVINSLAIGFMSADFVIWDLINESKVLQIPCGGWRRPYSYYLGAIAREQNCFAYLKGQEIHVHRIWVSVCEKQVFPQVLHMQFHGREIHTLSFIPLEKLKQKGTPCVLVATGCEDGTVRLTRYLLIERRWSDSKLLGEHVGGSAVRSICITPKVHPFRYHLNGSQSDSDINHEYSLLISVGSKQVLTCWVLNEGNARTSFEWFSSHIPPRINTSDKEEKHVENDWRYMAVTAFILRSSFARMSVCFIVVACSDASLILRALLLPSRLWFDVATLGQQMSPVLALQYILVGGNDVSTNEDRYIIISGATDGSITFWDLTRFINNFMQLIAEIQPQTLIDCQTRPKTGRGSCGGRKWRSLANYSSKNSNQEEEPALQNKNSNDLPEVQPLLVSDCVHQSGVNCLHVVSSDEGCFLLVTGGDDQALHCSTFRLEGPVTDGDIKIRVLSEDKIASAHSSAVKGIWTDGTWVFSAGLDQRVRCWKLNQFGKLAEHGHLIISVPEPETLDAVISDRENKRYQIAVAGRGMQMVEFSCTI
ncbi:WD repeat-containing protein 6 [Rhynchospora pubera]|uniref:WD repeat-containing protein 6 n=1 Tax=Rhynchospora pubera TaxID=906938 RepID=A0AAV8HX02_9POAL|nr:WD repeat-containing protein 6 [Rhynchospora pubera]